MEELQEELDAMEAVYGSDCRILGRSPLHVQVLVKPRTADDISQQFVEAVLVIKASLQYPRVPPSLQLVSTKGLDAYRQGKILSYLKEKADDLSNSLMLVAICEAALDMLLDLNFPEGDCSFCLCPLRLFNATGKEKPIMKLLSCFHCFHSHCFGRWWTWLQESAFISEQDDGGPRRSLLDSEASAKRSGHVPFCPICRAKICSEDIKHIKEFLNLHSPKEEMDPEDELTASTLAAEVHRRTQFAKVLETQMACEGIIEPRKLEAIQPGMLVTPRTSTAEECEIVDFACSTSSTGVYRSQDNGIKAENTCSIDRKAYPQQVSMKNRGPVSERHLPRRHGWHNKQAGARGRRKDGHDFKEDI